MVVGVTSSASAITAAALVSPHACKSLKILAVALVTDSPWATLKRKNPLCSRRPPVS